MQNHEPPKPKTTPEPNRPAEINPGKLDKEEVDLDKSGVGNTKGHEPYEFKRPESGGTGTRDGSSGSRPTLH